MLVQCSKNYFKIFLPQEAGAAFGNNIEKELQKPRQKIYVYIIYLQRIIALPAVRCKW